MFDKEYRAFLDLFMCSDPWPVGVEGGDDGHETLTKFADKQAKCRGYENWVVAYHELSP